MHNTSTEPWRLALFNFTVLTFISIFLTIQLNASVLEDVVARQDILALKKKIERALAKSDLNRGEYFFNIYSLSIKHSSRLVLNYILTGNRGNSFLEPIVKIKFKLVEDKKESVREQIYKGLKQSIESGSFSATESILAYLKNNGLETLKGSSSTFAGESEPLNDIQLAKLDRAIEGSGVVNKPYLKNAVDILAEAKQIPAKEVLVMFYNGGFGLPKHSLLPKLAASGNIAGIVYLESLAQFDKNVFISSYVNAFSMATVNGHYHIADRFLNSKKLSLEEVEEKSLHVFFNDHTGSPKKFKDGLRYYFEKGIDISSIRYWHFEEYASTEKLEAFLQVVSEFQRLMQKHSGTLAMVERIVNLKKCANR